MYLSGEIGTVFISLNGVWTYFTLSITIVTNWSTESNKFSCELHSGSDVFVTMNFANRIFGAGGSVSEVLYRSPRLGCDHIWNFVASSIVEFICEIVSFAFHAEFLRNGLNNTIIDNNGKIFWKWTLHTYRIVLSMIIAGLLGYRSLADFSEPQLRNALIYRAESIDTKPQSDKFVKKWHVYTFR